MRSNPKPSVPKLPCLAEFSFPLARMVAKAGYLPNPETVKSMGGAVFPTMRNSLKRVTPIEKDGVLMLLQTKM